MRKKHLPGRTKWLSFALTLGMVAIAGSASAQHQKQWCDESVSDCGQLTVSGHAPEIGLGGVGSALTLLTGGYFLLTSKLRRRQ